MQLVNSDTYLGDIVSSDGSNKLNIDNRISKGYGKIAEIMGILHKISLGRHYFKIAILLRNSLFVSSLLFNEEVWYGIKTSELAALESPDRKLLKRILGLPSSAPSAELYLELGLMRIGTILKARRLNFLHYLTKLTRSEMLSKFFRCQWCYTKEYDWCTQIRKDLADFDLPSDLAKISSSSKIKWNTLVKKRAKVFELRELLNMKQSKYKSKMGDLVYNSLTMQDYLVECEVNLAKIILSYRLNMSKFWGNFKGKEKMKMCPLCDSHEDLQCLSFQCPVIIEKVNPQV